MAMKPLVRIIKRGQNASTTESAAATPRQPQTPNSSARAIKETVSTWVKDFQQRSQADARLAFNSLFKEPLARQSQG